MARQAITLAHLLTFVALAGFAAGDLSAQRANGRGVEARAAAGGRQASNVNRNTNVNRNVNVDVDHHAVGYGARPVARGVVAGATAAAIIGHHYNSLPSGCTVVNRGGIVYHQCGSTWYKTDGNRYLVVAQP